MKDRWIIKQLTHAIEHLECTEPNVEIALSILKTALNTEVKRYRKDDVRGKVNN